MSNPHDEEIRPTPIEFGNEKCSDVTFFVEDQDFLAHRMVLAAHSDVFRAWLVGDLKENKDRIEIKDVSVDIFKKILEIMYYGRMTEFEAIVFEINYRIVEDYKAPFHTERTIETVIEAYQKFWKFVNELLEAADFFDVTDLVLMNLRVIIVENICTKSNCLFCLNLYMFALEKKMPILDKFHRFTKASYKEWHSVMYAEDAPMRQPPRQLDPQELLTFLEKFT